MAPKKCIFCNTAENKGQIRCCKDAGTKNHKYLVGVKIIKAESQNFLDPVLAKPES